MFANQKKPTLQINPTVSVRPFNYKVPPSQMNINSNYTNYTKDVPEFPRRVRRSVVNDSNNSINRSIYLRNPFYDPAYSAYEMQQGINNPRDPYRFNRTQVPQAESRAREKASELQSEVEKSWVNTQKRNTKRKAREVNNNFGFSITGNEENTGFNSGFGSGFGSSSGFGSGFGSSSGFGSGFGSGVGTGSSTGFGSSSGFNSGFGSKSTSQVYNQMNTDESPVNKYFSFGGIRRKQKSRKNLKNKTKSKTRKH